MFNHERTRVCAFVIGVSLCGTRKHSPIRPCITTYVATYHFNTRIYRRYFLISTECKRLSRYVKPPSVYHYTRALRYVYICTKTLTTFFKNSLALRLYSILRYRTGSNLTNGKQINREKLKATKSD